MRYRVRPLEVEAHQVTDDLDRLPEIRDWLIAHSAAFMFDSELNVTTGATRFTGLRLNVAPLEQQHSFTPVPAGSWIVWRAGYFYVHTDEQFTMIFEELDENSPAEVQTIIEGEVVDITTAREKREQHQ